jgi:hypothetical protein
MVMVVSGWSASHGRVPAAGRRREGENIARDDARRPFPFGSCIAAAPCIVRRSRRRQSARSFSLAKHDPGKNRPANALVPTKPGKAVAGSSCAPPTMLICPNSQLTSPSGEVVVRYGHACARPSRSEAIKCLVAAALKAGK